MRLSEIMFLCMQQQIDLGRRVTQVCYGTIYASSVLLLYGPGQVLLLLTKWKQDLQSLLSELSVANSAAIAKAAAEFFF